MRLVLIAALGAIAVACGAPTAKPATAQTPSASTDARLTGLYAQSCESCHGEGDMGAPMTGDVAAWRPRLRKGMPALVQSVVSGVGAMPAGGQCFSCTAADYEALIRFMAAERR